MKAFYKGNLFNEDQINLSIENRAFLYGDGLFETMTCKNSHVKYLSHHLQRICEGLQTLSILIPDFLKPKNMESIIKELVQVNEIKNFARIKIIGWRSAGGTYGPISSEGEILVTIKTIDPPKTKVSNNVSFSENMKNSYSIFSKFKTTNALKYVVAGIEKKNKNLDDIIILDEMGHISECLISNIFWAKDNDWFTPSLETGCIEGTSRRIILSEANKHGIKVHEVKSPKDELLKADSIFTTNSSGVQHILRIDGISFKAEPRIEKIYQPI